MIHFYIMEIATKYTYFFINMELGHHLPVTQLVSVLEQTDVSSEQPLMENRTTLLLVVWEIMEAICFSCCPLKLTTVVWYLRRATASQRLCWKASLCSSHTQPNQQKSLEQIIYCKNYQQMTQKPHHSEHPIWINSPAQTAMYIQRTFNKQGYKHSNVRML
jgi:hypothetical protein